MTTVHSEDETVFLRDNSHEPLPAWRKCDWKGSPDAAGFRQDAYESNGIRARRLSSKRILRLQADKIAAVAEHDVRFEGQLPEQLSSERCPRPRLANDKGARRTHIHDIMVAQFSGEDARAKRSVSANIDASEEDDESHGGIIKKKAGLRMRIRLPLLVIAAATLFIGSARSQGPQRQDSLSITFLANEGVLLSSGSKQVLIDGLFLKYETGFAIPADSTRAALERARSPFDAVDLVLVTHRHGDHFHPAPVVAHLVANPGATLLTSRQVIDSLRGRLPGGALAARLMARTTAPGARRREVVGGIEVELLGLPHGGTRHRGVEHLGYIVDVGGRRVLHVGDTDFTEATFAPFRLDTARIDVALLPHWMVTSREGRRVIERWIRPRHVVAFHVGEDEMERVPREVQAAVPGAITFVRSLETRRW